MEEESGLLLLKQCLLDFLARLQVCLANYLDNTLATLLSQFSTQILNLKSHGILERDGTKADLDPIPCQSQK